MGPLKFFHILGSKKLSMLQLKSLREHPIELILNGYIDSPTIAGIKNSNGQININFEELRS